MSSIAHFTYRLFASEPQSSPYRMVSVAKNAPTWRINKRLLSVEEHSYRCSCVCGNAVEGVLPI